MEFLLFCLLAYVAWRVCKAFSDNKENSVEYQAQPSEIVITPEIKFTVKGYSDENELERCEPVGDQKDWKSIYFAYQNAKGETSERTVSIRYYERHSFFGYCGLRNDTRSFRYDRIAGQVTNTDTGEVITPAQFASLRQGENKSLSYIEKTKLEYSNSLDFDLFGTSAALAWNDKSEVEVICIESFSKKKPTSKRYDRFTFETDYWMWSYEPPKGAATEVKKVLAKHFR